jgi:outer membrane scaffolding protein for murein synthesis (MipA/OmpV family)
MYLDLSLARRGALAKRGGFYAFGPVLRLGDDNYKDSLFSVTAAESASSGLREYAAGGGLERLGLQGLISVPLGESRWRWTTIARVARLIDNAADSPVVVDATQLFMLMSLTRRF